MCLIIFAYQAHPDYPLVVAANRDEFHQRPTRPSRFWQDHPGLLAGRDRQLGGTWMGITRDGRFAAVTNFRDPARTAPAPRSRGELTINFLTGDLSPVDYMATLEALGSEYAGFNLLVGDRDGLWYLTNSEPGGPQAVAPGIYGLSNAHLDTPWPKVISGKAALRNTLDNEVTHEHLAAAVSSREMADRKALDQQGLCGEMDQLLSAPFIVNESYGTRATTTLWLERDRTVHWRERSFDPAGEQTGECIERFGLA